MILTELSGLLLLVPVFDKPTKTQNPNIDK